MKGNNFLAEVFWPYALVPENVRVVYSQWLI